MKKKKAKDKPAPVIELYRKHRPDDFSRMVGQADAVRTLISKKGKFPHAMLFTGATGSGKTTSARIVAAKLGATAANYNLEELNAGLEGGKDTIRKIEETLRYKPLGGGNKVYIIDEAHGLTKQAQEALLIPTEDPPDHTYFILCTTDPQKILPTLRGRCTEVKFAPLKHAELRTIIFQVGKKEGFELDDKLADAIADAADGSGRKAVVLLEQVMSIKDADDRLDAVVKADTKVQAVELCRAIMFPPKGGGSKWAAAQKILKELKDDPEQVRHLMLAYATSVLLGGNPAGAKIIDIFQYNFYDSKRAGLVLAAFKACGGK